MADLSLESTLLRASLARRCGAEPPPDFTELFARVDWSRFLWLGLQHQVLVAWRHALLPAEIALIPPAILAQLQALTEVNQLQHLSRAGESCRLHDLFARAGLESVVMSGWALAQRHHAQPSLRELEPATALWVRAADAARATASLASAGYASPERLRLPQRHRSDLWLLPPFQHAGPTDKTAAAALWARTEIRSLHDRPFRLLEPHDWLLRLCAVGGDHLWQSLHRAIDVAELLRSTPEMDWAGLELRARALGLHRALLLGVGITCELLHRPLPGPVRAALSADAPLAATLAQLVARHRHGETTLPSETARQEIRALLGIPASAAPADPGEAAGDPGNLGRFAPTPEALGRRMLEFAAVGPADVVHDLGCGDGRLVIEAAVRFGARGVGVDRDPARIAEANQRAQAAGVGADRVRFTEGDLRDAPLSDATVVCLYLQDFAYDRLRPHLERTLRPGTRIVSHRFTFSGWPPEQTCLVRTAPDQISPLHLWRVGAGAASQP